MVDRVMLKNINLRVKLLMMPYYDMEEDFHRKLEKLLKAKDTIKYYENLSDIIKSLLDKHKFKISEIRRIDEYKLLLESYYSFQSNNFEPERGSIVDSFYLKRLEDVANIFLCHRNGRIAIKYWDSPKNKNLIGPYSGYEKILMWNSLNRTVCTDILAIMYIISNNIGDVTQLASYHGHVYLADTQLDQILSKGIAETHLHGKAARYFDIQWIELVNQWDSCDLGINEDLQNHIHDAAIIRVLLAAFLCNKSAINTFYNYYTELKSNCINQVCSNIIEYYLDNGNNLNGDLLEAYNKKECYDFLCSYYQLQGSVVVEVDYDNSNNYYWHMPDCITMLLKEKGNYCSTENEFLYHSLHYMYNNQDGMFGKLFWKYIRIKNTTFECHVQKDYLKGLDYFAHIYNRSTPSHMQEVDYWKINFHKILTDQYIKKVEVRISPTDKMGNLAKKIVDILKAYKWIIGEFEKHSRLAPRLGIIIHFIKEQDKTQLEKCWNQYCTYSCDATFLSYRSNHEKYNQQMVVFRDIREKIPRLSDYLVGIDAASLENDTEPWVFAPIFRNARDSKTHKLVDEDKQRIRNLGFTYHVGEDFRHIISGLRHIDEVLEHFQFHAGDRLGHGIAVGVNVKKWVISNSVTVMPRIEYLENLLWMWGLQKNIDHKIPLDMTFLERNVLECAKEIFGLEEQNIEGISVYKLWNVYRKKFNMFEEVVFSNENDFDKNWLQEKVNGYCSIGASLDQRYWTEERLLLAFHCRPYMLKMQETIQIKVEVQEIETISMIQLFMRKKVSDAGIIIETNPSSNAIIGDIEHIYEHHILNLCSDVNSQEIRDYNVMATINSDDPLVFNTNISNEFAYIYYALLHKGLSRETVLNWIDKVRERGVLSSFIDERQLTNNQLLAEVDNIIEKLEEYINYGL